jgi:2-polyprenyl-3-methyl-5-hydroxy-6-metoxy-1,4-benzoquinol methylase
VAYIYDTTVDPDAENNSHALILDLVGSNKRVLEVGCATGYVTKVLTERGCDVVGIELDADAAARAESWAERVIVGDLNVGMLWQELDGELFDVVTFGDVLEHLLEPLDTLRAAVRHLKPTGFVVISVPNIAHGDVRIALLLGTFPYRETGLLDRSHVRFFTKTALRAMIDAAGLLLVETRKVVVPLFQTELGVTGDSVDQSIVNVILEDREAETYQFVVKVVPDNGLHAVTSLADRVAELTDQNHDEMIRTALLHQEMDQLKREGETRRAEAEAYRLQLEALLNTKTFRFVAPLRKAYGWLHRGPNQRSLKRKTS